MAVRPRVQGVKGPKEGGTWSASWRWRDVKLADVGGFTTPRWCTVPGGEDQQLDNPVK